MKWTVYSEEKPQKVGSYLVTHTTDSGRNYVDYDYWTVADKFKYHPTDVVAWMPFPKPYGAEQTEPQYDVDKLTIKCGNCSESGSYKCSKCDGEMYFKRLEPKDEPQTERSE